MKTVQEIRETINQITYKNGWEVKFYDGDRPYIQVEFDGEDAETGLVEKQK